MPLSTLYSVLPFLKRNSFKNKTGCYDIAISRRNFVNRADLKKTCPRLLKKEQLIAKIKSMSVKLKKLWLICAQIIFCPTCILVEDRFGGTTFNCHNWLNIDSNDLMFYQKIDNNFLHFLLELCFRAQSAVPWNIMLKLPLSTHCTKLENFRWEILSRINPADTLLQFTGKVL